MGNKFYRIRVEIILDDKRRKNSIKNGYRPAFLCNGKLITGHVIMLGSPFLNPGESGIAEISFISNDFLRNIKIDDIIPFYEGPAVQLGYVVVKEIPEKGEK